MDTYTVSIHSRVLHIMFFFLSVVGSRFEQVENRSMNKLTEKYEVHTEKLRNVFDKYLYGNKLLLVF